MQMQKDRVVLIRSKQVSRESAMVLILAAIRKKEQWQMPFNFTSRWQIVEVMQNVAAYPSLETKATTCQCAMCLSLKPS